MTKTKPSPTLSGGGAAARDARRKRLAAALRENLRKRKAQTRDRAASDEPTTPKSEHS